VSAVGVIELDLRSNSNYSYGGTSNGFLIKFIDKNKYIKTGRQRVRGTDKCGIEPIIECVVYELCKALNVKVASEKLGIAIYKHHNIEKVGLVNVSENFVPENTTLQGLDEAVVWGNLKDTSLKELFRTVVNKDDVWKMLFIDALILNEDRHNGNVSILKDKDKIKLSPLYDMGYSLLYDDIKVVTTGDYERAVKLCNCNAPLYNFSFDTLYKLIAEYQLDCKKYNEKPVLPLLIRDKTVEKCVIKVMNDYKSVYSDVNNIKLTDGYFEGLYHFISERIKFVRNLWRSFE